jgi:uncharacterized protein (TIGR00255 family)
MIRSMTAFARLSHSAGYGQLTWELRSVNHRYMEPHFKLPETMRALEPALRERLREQLSRGKLECILKLTYAHEQQTGLQVNLRLAQQVIDACQSVHQLMPSSQPEMAINILQWPGVIEDHTIDAEQLHADALLSFDQALEQLRVTREREGHELSQLVLERLDGIRTVTKSVRERLPTILQQQRERVLARFAELKLEVDRDRLEQEMVLILQKADVDEELDRLSTHVNEVQRVLKAGGACGRRLDFLMQELNREANTLSSKSIVSDTTQSAVELKVLIEQMREQIQNIE